MSDDLISKLYPDDVVPEATDQPAPIDATPVDRPEGGEVAAPEKYDLQLDGLDLDTGLIAEAEPIFRELGLSNKQANALLPIAPKIVASAQDKIIKSLIDEGTKQRKAWLDAFAADKEIGGQKRAESERLAVTGLEKLGFGRDHPFRVALTETGFGNHPDMIRILRWVGAASGNQPSGGAGSSALDRLYPNG